LTAEDLGEHWDVRLEVKDDKAMIVCMSRRIGYELYGPIGQLRPEWNHKDDGKGVMKIVMTGSADKAIRTGEFLAERVSP
jgi:type I restriction enzyme R subunit